MNEIKKDTKETFESLMLKQIEKQLTDSNVIQDAVNSHFLKMVQDVVEEAFRYGEVKKAVSDKLKESMAKCIESVDFSKYIVKLDSVLTQVLEDATLDNKKLLSNFSNLMQQAKKDEMSINEIFEVWKKFVQKEVDTTGMNVNDEEGEPEYEAVDVHMEVDRESNGRWGKIIFTCDKDDKGYGNEDLHYELSTYFNYDDDSRATVYYHNDHRITSLRTMNDFEVFLLRISQWNCKITEIENMYYDDEVIPETKPEPTYR